MSAVKKALRLEMGKRRAIAHASVDPAPAIETLIAALRTALGPISFYWPIRTELDPRTAMRALCEVTEVCLPVTQGFGPLTFRAWHEDAEMETDGFGVQTPTSDAETLVPSTLVVPMLAFDAHCHRLGYGAGHYDRTIEKLKSHQPVTTIGFAYSAQRVETPLPIEATDQPLDLIITECGPQTPAASSV